MTLSTRSARPQDESAVIALWRRCAASYNEPAADFRFARAGEASDVLVAVDQGGGICGSTMVGNDGHRGWSYYIAADPEVRGKIAASTSRRRVCPASRLSRAACRSRAAS